MSTWAIQPQIAGVRSYLLPESPNPAKSHPCLTIYIRRSLPPPKKYFIARRHYQSQNTDSRRASRDGALGSADRMEMAAPTQNISAFSSGQDLSLGSLHFVPDEAERRILTTFFAKEQIFLFKCLSFPHDDFGKLHVYNNASCHTTIQTLVPQPATSFWDECPRRSRALHPPIKY